MQCSSVGGRSVRRNARHRSIYSPGGLHGPAASVSGAVYCDVLLREVSAQRRPSVDLVRRLVLLDVVGHYTLWCAYATASVVHTGLGLRVYC